MMSLNFHKMDKLVKMCLSVGSETLPHWKKWKENGECLQSLEDPWQLHHYCVCVWMDQWKANCKAPCCVTTEGCTVPWWLWSGCRWVDPGAPRQRAARCQSCPWSGRRWCGRAPRRSSPCLGTFWSHGAAWTARLSLHRLGRGGTEAVE